MWRIIHDEAVAIATRRSGLSGQQHCSSAEATAESSRLFIEPAGRSDRERVQGEDERRRTVIEKGSKFDDQFVIGTTLAVEEGKACQDRVTGCIGWKLTQHLRSTANDSCCGWAMIQHGSTSTGRKAVCGTHIIDLPGVTPTRAARAKAWNVRFWLRPMAVRGRCRMISNRGAVGGC